MVESSIFGNIYRQTLLMLYLNHLVQCIHLEYFLVLMLIGLNCIYVFLSDRFLKMNYENI